MYIITINLSHHRLLKPGHSLGPEKTYPLSLITAAPIRKTLNKQHAKNPVRPRTLGRKAGLSTYPPSWPRWLSLRHVIGRRNYEACFSMHEPVYKEAVPSACNEGIPRYIYISSSKKTNLKVTRIPQHIQSHIKASPTRTNTRTPWEAASQAPLRAR